MKFNIIISRYPVKANRGEVNGPRTTLEMEGDLDAVKTYLKLAAPEDFNWGAVERLDEMETGDVSRWMIRKDRVTGDLSLNVFSFHNVDPEINVNAMRGAMDHDANTKMQALNKALGGGKF